MNSDDPQNLLRPPKRTRIGDFIGGIFKAIGATGMTLATGGYAWRKAPFAVEYPQIEMPLRRLPPSLDGFRIIQFTDLHTGFRTPVSFLRRVVQQINDMKADLIVVTGDLVTHTKPKIKEACDIVAALRGNVVVTFGNHDYTREFHIWQGHEIADELQAELTKKRIPVLRNQAMSIDRPDGRLWIVGLEDLWSGNFSPEKALAGVNHNDPVIALSHNPDTVYALSKYGVQWVLAGHTHGGQIRIPLAGSLVLPVVHKQFDLGLFQIDQTRMYVSRGVGFRVPVRFRCRPEVACFTLKISKPQMNTDEHR